MINLLRKYKCCKTNKVTLTDIYCIKTILKQYCFKKSINYISKTKIANNNEDNNISIVSTLNHLGFNSKELNIKSFDEFIYSIPLPVIATINEDNIKSYIVIYKITKDAVITSNPLKGIVKYNLNDFLSIFSGTLITAIPKVDLSSNKKGFFKKFSIILKPQKRLVFTIFLFSLIVTSIGIISTFYFKYITDTIIPNNMNSALNKLSIGVIILILSKLIIDSIKSQLLIYLGQNIDIALMLGYYEHLLDLPMNFFDKTKVGDMISRFNDSGKIRDGICNTTLTIMIDSIMAVFAGVILYLQNRILFSITLIPLMLYSLIVYKFKKPIEESNRETMQNGAKVTSYLISSLNGVENIKSYNAELDAKFHTQKKFLILAKSVFRKGLITNIQYFLKSSIKSIFAIIVIWIGSMEVLKGRLTIGELLTFNALLAYFFTPLENIVNLQPTIQTASVAAERLSQYLDLEVEKIKNESNKIYLPSLRYNIEFQNVSFAYNDNYVLKDICLNIPSGKKVAFVGESGSGKSTLAKLILSFYKCNSGEILINDININDIDLENLRSKISYVSQNIFLFSGSIKENLTLGNHEVCMEEIIKSCEMAQIHEFIDSLPDKYDSLIEDNGSNLSSGQKQRLALARAILKNPDILILDEATNNLDSITEKIIEDTLKDFCKNKTTIIIAHNLNSITHCDTIYVIDNGSIIESGTHEQLISLNNKYSSYWNKKITSA